ncbi:hypothetical protein [Lewinella sp. IMCC34183]|uniref:hypothetical protein n=1 Tax=Lewinella sp. IMCC34183 TaxID=2248762 RepID=UPI000E271341|nr:hypothetical protein [Lewinella sp. IMCC34183]
METPLLKSDAVPPDRRHPNSWLDRLQQESWQLELILSGFAIFLLLAGYSSFYELDLPLGRKLLNNEAWRPVSIAYYVMRTGYLALIICLLVHLLLRGVWIAAIGLRSVSGDIDYGRLGYRPRYERFLMRRIGSFDSYLDRLERLCSVAFSLAFLIICCFFSLVAYTMACVVLQVLNSWLFGEAWQWEGGIFGGGGWLNLILLLVGLLFMIDFLSLGFFKRNRWTAGAFYPIYRLMGWVTLAALYRPLYHNLVDNRFGRRLARLLPLFILVALLSVSVRSEEAAYLPYFARDGKHVVEANNYDDTAYEPAEYLRRSSLASKYPDHGYLELFVPYLPRYHDPVIEALAPDLASSRYPGIKLRGAFTVGELYNPEADYSRTLAVLSRLHRVLLDGTDTVRTAPRFHHHAGREQDGLLYVLPLHDLAVGEHTLTVETRYDPEDTTDYRGYGHIYFYK